MRNKIALSERSYFRLNGMASSKTTTLVTEILSLLDGDWISWSNVLELLAYDHGLKQVVRLAVDKETSGIIADFCHRYRWPYRLSDFWLEPVFRTNLNDTFSRLVYGNAPSDCIRVLFIGREVATRRAEKLEAIPDRKEASELALLYGYPKCCTTAYAEVQSGLPWLDAYLSNSSIQGQVWNWRSNKIAYLFPPHHTLLPEYFPCSVACESTIRLAQSYEAVLRNYGLTELLDIVRDHLMRPMLFFSGSLYRFGGLELRDGWYHVVGSTERHIIDDQAVQLNQKTNTIEAIRVGCGELWVRNTLGEWHEQLIPARTQLLRFGYEKAAEN